MMNLMTYIYIYTHTYMCVCFHLCFTGQLILIAKSAFGHDDNDEEEIVVQPTQDGVNHQYMGKY